MDAVEVEEGLRKAGMVMTSNSFASSVDAPVDPVRAATDEEVLRKIDAKIEENIRFYATQGAEAISRRVVWEWMQKRGRAGLDFLA